MAEKVIVRQGRDFATSFQALDPEAAAAGLRPVQRLHELTPYGMLLAGLGSCTALVVNSYAGHRGIPLEAVVLTLEYRRSHREDCEHCADPGKEEEKVDVSVVFEGALTAAQKEKLLLVAHHCPVHSILLKGIAIEVHAG